MFVSVWVRAWVRWKVQIRIQVRGRVRGWVSVSVRVRSRGWFGEGEGLQLGDVLGYRFGIRLALGYCWVHVSVSV